MQINRNDVGFGSIIVFIKSQNSIMRIGWFGKNKRTMLFIDDRYVKTSNHIHI